MGGRWRSKKSYFSPAVRADASVQLVGGGWRAGDQVAAIGPAVMDVWNKSLCVLP